MLALPMVLALRSPSASPWPVAASSSTLGGAVTGALRDRNYLLLTAGFFVCGFHVAFIATHLPGVVASCGLPPEVGAWSLAIIGLFNMAGSFSIGWAMDRWRMKSLLSLIYAARAAAIFAFMLAPKTELTFLLFAAAIGFTYLSTVPATAGLVAKLHGARYMATLFGLTMLSHQVGGFLGAWLGGKAFEATGSYDWMWWADMALGIAAALVHLPIREAAPIRPVAAAAA
jgi:predicted MFS family arabinose efflux permease